MSTILIVDDLSANRRTLIAQLGQQGHRLLEAADGREGLAVAKTEHPDLVITDVLMPVMDGHEFVRQLRLDPTTSRVPVVFSTAHYGAHEARVLALASGVSHVLTKPTRREELLRIVGSVLSEEAETARLQDDALPLSASDGEHLRLLTNELWDKAEDLRTANLRSRALINIALELAAERNSDRRLQSVCWSVCDLFGATYATLGIVDPENRTVQHVVTCGVDPANWIETGDAVTGILGDVVAERRTLCGDNRVADPARLRFPVGHPDVQAFLAAPIASPQRVYGWICLVGNEGRSFTSDDEQLVKALAGQVGRTYDLEHEILERKRAESALRDERDRAQRYLDTAEVMLIALDLAGRITLVNRYACSVLGWPADELLGRVWIETCLPARLRAAWKQKLPTIAKGNLPVGENPVLTRSGEERLIEWRNTVLRDKAGLVIGTLSSGADITERRTLEEQCHQAQKLEAVGRLAGGVAHDFNNLLTLILGHCELVLADLDPDDPHQPDIAQIEKAGTRAAALTRQLMAFSRREIIAPTRFDLSALVAGMRAMLGRLIGEDVDIVLDLRPEQSPVTADHGQLEQVVMNLAVNARDAMPRGGTLTIKTAIVDLDEADVAKLRPLKPGPYVVLTVTDTGSGMTPDVQARLFEPFFTTKEAGKGTGLGLATVHGIVTRCGGAVIVSTEVGRGTSFKLYFPRADATEMIAEAATQLARATAVAETVLVVEDSDGLRELAARLLRRQGYTVLVAANADEAVELFERNASIDVLLTDVVMPGLNGLELAKQLVEQRPTLKVIYMSGYTEEAIVRRGGLHPVIGVLDKPFTTETLVRKFREVLDA
jgi:PAS domain S-box-containing protein